MTPRIKELNSHKDVLNSQYLEPYTSPGDYDVPKLLGNKSIMISSIKTPP